MNNLYIFTGGLIIIWCIYKLFTFLLFQRLKNKLRDSDIDVFKKMLGEKYKYRTLTNGLLRCKWSNPILIVKANFDEEGKLICTKIQPYNIFRLKFELSFTGLI